MYYDKFGGDSIISIEYGPGTVNPKIWGAAQAPTKPKKRVRRNS
jgi:hypothetical protein